MSVRPIDANELISAMYYYEHNEGGLTAYDAQDIINKAPTIEPKRGEWIWSPRDTDGTVSGCCSNCSFSHLFIGGHTSQYNFCPNCGARMKGADDE